jgi:hypothetical protein
VFPTFQLCRRICWLQSPLNNVLSYKDIMQHSVLLLTHVAVTWFLVGLIWVIQVVHYPLFAEVGEQHFARYEQLHQRRITVVVAPLMLLEVITTVLLWWSVGPVIPVWQYWLALGLLAAIWLSTALLQIPAHAKLSSTYDLTTINWLVQTNWIRTIAWTARGVIVAYWVWLMMSHKPV